MLTISFPTKLPTTIRWNHLDETIPTNSHIIGLFKEDWKKMYSITLSPPNLKMLFGTTFIFNSKRAFRKQILT